MEENKPQEQPQSSLPAINNIDSSSRQLANMTEQEKQDLIAGLKSQFENSKISFGDIFNKGVEMAMKNPKKFGKRLFGDTSQLAAELAGEVIISKAKEIEAQKKQLGDGK